ncbi:hypothetical protein T484DRAFT_1784923 [Baffinella frigidus]|nr:hypothetical protein T484DRAFT_1784923 [Cryptophyta sp. CCMP2293]
MGTEWPGASLFKREVEAEEELSASTTPVGQKRGKGSKGTDTQGPVTNKRVRKAESARAKAAVREANGFRGSTPSSSHPIPGGRTLELGYAHSLEGERLEWAYGLLEDNMRAMYEKAWGWSDDQKRFELESPRARYILAYLSPAPSSAAGRVAGASPGGAVSASEEGGGADGRVAVGFVHYRFVEDARRPVAYVYEIQDGPAFF